MLRPALSPGEIKELGMIAVIATRQAKSAFHYTLLLNQSGYQTLAVRETAPY